MGRAQKAKDKAQKPQAPPDIRLSGLGLAASGGSAMDGVQKARYRRIRNSWGLGLAALWIVFWLIKLDAANHAALANCHDGDLLAHVGCEGSTYAGFGGKVLLVLFVSPLAFLVSHYFAKWRIEQIANTERLRREQEDQARRRVLEAKLDQMRVEAAQRESQTRRNDNRHALIVRLGAVDDQLVVLEGQTDLDRITRIKLTITESLRELNTNFTNGELRAMRSADSGIEQRVDLTLSEMRRLGLEGSRQYQDLVGMFGCGEPSAKMDILSRILTARHRS